MKQFFAKIPFVAIQVALFTFIAWGIPSIITGCANFNGPIVGVKQDPTINVFGNEVCFTKEVLPILQSNCASSGCHDAVTKEDGYEFTNYTTIIKKGILVGNPNGSKVFNVTALNALEPMPPPPRTALTDVQRETLRRWISEGAKNTDCSTTISGSCDTTMVTYSKTVSAIIQTNCLGCHSGGAPSGGVNLGSYSTIKTYTSNGRLQGALEGQRGFVQMPPDRKLDPCQISQIRTWIRIGASNN